VPIRTPDKPESTVESASIASDKRAGVIDDGTVIAPSDPALRAAEYVA
jgi:hypothetical protein